MVVVGAFAALFLACINKIKYGLRQPREEKKTTKMSKQLMEHFQQPPNALFPKPFNPKVHEYTKTQTHTRTQFFFFLLNKICFPSKYF